MNYDEALQYIHSVNWTFCKPGLERIEQLCDLLGHPERALKFIHIAGTNGKGSTSAMLSSVLIEAGYKVGLYTSPYIYRFNERMRVNGVDIPDDALAKITERVKPIADSMEDKPTEFELITAIAFLYFAEEKCDIVVLEAGMGGRLDSTNIISSPLLSVITGIALDHTAFLGDTIENIAKEKAGIIKDGSPVLFGGEDAGARQVIAERADRLGVKLYSPDYSLLTVKEATLAGTILDYKEMKDVKISLLGLYQPKNTALVLEAISVLKNDAGLSISSEAIYRGLERTRWRARFEIISNDPLVIFDGAHNPEGIDAAVKSIKHYYKQTKVVILTGMMRDKDYFSVAKRFSEICDFAITITPDNPRALPAEEFAEVLRGEGITSLAFSTIKDALKSGRDVARERGTALFCLGSLYSYTDVIKYI